jgi:hypothetical protein
VSTPDDDALVERFVAQHFPAAATPAEPQTFFGVDPTATTEPTATPTPTPPTPSPRRAHADYHQGPRATVEVDEHAAVDAYLKHHGLIPR